MANRTRQKAICEAQKSSLKYYSFIFNQSVVSRMEKPRVFSSVPVQEQIPSALRPRRGAVPGTKLWSEKSRGVRYCVPPLER
jgi:hypothetical protein